VKRQSCSWLVIPALIAACLADSRPSWSAEHPSGSSASVPPQTALSGGRIRPPEDLSAPKAVPTCSNIAWQHVQAPVPKSFLQIVQAQDLRLVFDVYHHLKNKSLADDLRMYGYGPHEEPSYESIASTRIILNGNTGQFSSVSRDYTFKVNTRDPFSIPKDLARLKPRFLSPLFDPAPRQDTPEYREYDWWQRLFHDSSVSSSGGSFTGKAGFHYFPAAQTWTIKGSLAFVVGFGHELLAWDNVAPSVVPKFEHQAVQFLSGRRYDFWAHRGTRIASENAPSPRSDFAFATLGHKLLIWGGTSSGKKPEPLTDGAIYDLQTNHWTPIPAEGAPASCHEATAVVLGEVALIQGSGPCQEKSTKRICHHGYGTWSSAPSAWSIYDPRTNHFTQVDESVSPSMHELCSNKLIRVGSLLVSLGKVGWIFDPMTNRWSHFELPNLSPPGAYRSLRRDPEIALSSGQLLMLEVGYEQPIVYVVYPAQQHVCRLPLDKLPFFSRREGWYSGVAEVADLDGKFLLWGRFDKQRSDSLDPGFSVQAPHDNEMDQGFIVSLPKEP
jgi:hypothetical protein